ncbi:nose resistant to fluoxetine protein 6-like [Periplaneta americana]|uniref:nose resistant to fluoxetine protein 6-like n=1 Tax=Periplaneta americana TaxID=6978 RepID=UPI0037E79F33
MFQDVQPLPTNGISQTCINHTISTLKQVFKGSRWPLQMLDATSKVPSGLMQGNVFEFGNFDECLDVDVHEDWGSFIGQHCVTMFKLNNPALEGFVGSAGAIPLFWSICTPSSCTPQDLQYGLSKISPNFIVDPVLCHTRTSSRPLETIDWITIALLVFIAIMCILSTAYDIIVKNKERRNKIFLIFSWRTNGKALFSTRVGKDALPALNGLRFLSMCFLVYGHTISTTMATPSVNMLSFMELARDWPQLYVGNLTFAVDTFFVMSGMLLCYLVLKGLDIGKPFNIPLFYFHRLLRLTPLLGIAILIHASIIDKFGSGPLWDYVYGSAEKKYCVDNWWSTLLHVQNYVNLEESCITPSWYLAVDTQLYIISPIFLLSLRKWPRFGLGLTIATTIGGMIASFVESYTRKDNPNFIRIGTSAQLGYSYFHTHTRGVSWFVGFLFGYLFYRTTDWRAKVSAGTEKLSKVTVTLGWLLTIIALSLVYISLHPFLQKDYEYNAVHAGFYYALARPIWSVCMAWIIFACLTGYGGTVNTILSWPGWMPFARLTFAMYIFHFDFIFARLASIRTPVYGSVYLKVQEWFENLAMTIILSIVMTLSIESPIIQLEKLIFSKDRKNRSRNLPQTIRDDMLNINSKNERQD